MEASEMQRHRPAILTHEYPTGFRSDPQNLQIGKPGESGFSRGSHVNFWRSTPQPAEYTSVEIGVSLESDSHAARVEVSRSVPHSSVSIVRVAIQRHAAHPQGIYQSLSG